MTVEENRSPSSMSPVRRASRLVVRKSLEPRKTIFNSSPSPSRSTLSTQVSFRGSVVVRSPRTRPSILPRKEESPIGHFGTETDIEDREPTASKRIRYAPEELRQLKPPTARQESPIPGPHISNMQKRDPAIVFCSPTPQPLPNVSSVPIIPEASPVIPDVHGLAGALQRFLALDKDDRQKLQNLLDALDHIDKLAALPARASQAPLAIEKAEIPLLTPTNSADPSPIEHPKGLKSLNPEAPAFCDFPTLKDKASQQKDESCESSKQGSAGIGTTSTRSQSLQRTHTPVLNWKMTPQRTWPQTVKQQLRDSRRAPSRELPKCLRPTPPVKIPANTPIIPPAEVTICPRPGSRPPPAAAPGVLTRSIVKQPSTIIPQIPSASQPIAQLNNYIPEIANWLQNQSHGPIWLPAGVHPPWMTAVPSVPQVPWIGQVPFFPINNAYSPPPPYHAPALDPSNFDDISDVPGAPGGREAFALPQFWAAKQLDRFSDKYPLTGTPS
ncbi:hypothetical protein B0O99DRAFT_613146 [Bisporella sp. PMI_857]|nr:hypothetical protein B0O99DRAFT_613146 [Bisporella sp. PMI_857]